MDLDALWLQYLGVAVAAVMFLIIAAVIYLAQYLFWHALRSIVGRRDKRMASITGEPWMLENILLYALRYIHSQPSRSDYWDEVVDFIEAERKRLDEEYDRRKERA